ncbi:SDR family NAD(P)-dependent oxidoreductase [Calothrix sp. CCY 0018]|uniref:SDR family NAD(P)-dependent oxidoreductase n=1 Tax=Calothrix sp. CCY 0018 TaxID=3103864 RepID=UPI0039C697BF
MSQKLSGRVAPVTGATLGIGRATAIALGAAGAKVVFSGRRDAEGEKTAKLIRETLIPPLKQVH